MRKKDNGDKKMDYKEEGRKDNEKSKIMEGKNEESRRRGRPMNVERLGRERSESYNGRVMRI